MLNVKHLTVYSKDSKNKNYLIDDICFNLDKGDCLGIYGKSGSGKTTLAKSLLEIYDNNVFYEKGDILIDNKPFCTSDRGKKICVLFQNPNSYLNPLMKVGKQIEEMLTYHLKEKNKDAKIKVIDIMRKVGIDNPELIYSYYPHEISGGTKQRICLCICLILKCDILILDEFTSFLDYQSKKEILSLLKSIQKERNLTLIIISHDLKELYQMCSKLAIMRNGRMIEFGKKNEIILSCVHPYTIELLVHYLSFYENVPDFICPLMEIEIKENAPIVMISETHYVRNWYFDKRALKVELPIDIKTIKEKIYESLNN